MTSNDWIFRVIDYVEENLNSPIKIEDLADISGYSQRHFQRLFRDRTAERIMEYIRGRRLTRAMEEIVDSQKSILDIAIDYQFESQQSFTRAFQSRFAHPPIRFRDNKVSNSPASKKRLDTDYIEMIENGCVTLEPSFVDLDERFFVGLQTKIDINSFGSIDLSQAPPIVNEFKMRVGEIDQSIRIEKEKGLLFATYRVPRSKRASFDMDDDNSGDGLLILAGVEIKSLIQIPPDMVLLKSPASKFAVFECRGTLANINQAGYYLTSSWAPRSLYWIGNAPVVSYMNFGQENSLKAFLPLRTRQGRLIDPWCH